MRNIFKAVIITAMIAIVGDLSASNGLLLTSYGVRYGGMGGASLALHGSAMDLAMNPANMARNEEKSIFEMGFSHFMPTLTYQDSFMSPDMNSNYVNNMRSTPNKLNGYVMPHAAFTSKINDNAAWGVAAYAAAGGGSQLDGITRKVPGFYDPKTGVYNHYPTMNELMKFKMGPDAELPYIGNSKWMKESTFSELQIGKITAGFAYKIGKLSLGAGLDLGIGTLQWRWTFQDPMGMMDMPGSGYRYKSDVAYAPSGKVGLTYEITETVAASYAYQAGSRFDFNGNMSIDAGSGDPVAFKPRGYETVMQLRLPESHRGGLAYHKGPLTLSFDIAYIKWASAISTVKFKTIHPLFLTADLPPAGFSIANDATGKDTNSLDFNMKWRDQRVYAVGLEYKPSSLAFRVGYNYGNSPITSEGNNPLFPAISENHYTAGLGLDLGSIEIDFTLEYAAPSKVDTGDMSDWEMFHAFSGLTDGDPSALKAPPGMQTPYYNSSITSEILVPQIALKYKF